MSRRIAAGLLGTLAALAAVLIGARGAQADDGSEARALLKRSHAAAADHEFEGTVVIEWTEGGTRRDRTVAVEVDDGVLRMGKDLVSAGTRRLLRTDDGWQLLWSSKSSGAEPDPTDKYTFVVADPTSVAERAATEVTVAREGSKKIRERLFFDDETGMLLRRDQLNPRGKLVRRFAFVEMSTPRAVEPAGVDLPKANAKSSVQTPQAMKDAPDELDAPKRIGRGFRLSGVYSQPDGSVQLYYSDGLLGLSVFERAGELAWDELPAGGRTIDLDGERARMYTTSAGTAAVWDADNVTYTAVTDAPLDEVHAIAEDFSNGEDPSMLEEIGEFVTAPFTWG